MHFIIRTIFCYLSLSLTLPAEVDIRQRRSLFSVCMEIESNCSIWVFWPSFILFFEFYLIFSLLFGMKDSFFNQFQFCFCFWSCLITRCSKYYFEIFGLIIDGCCEDFQKIYFYQGKELLKNVLNLYDLSYYELNIYLRNESHSFFHLQVDDVIINNFQLEIE